MWWFVRLLFRLAKPPSYHQELKNMVRTMHNLSHRKGFISSSTIVRSTMLLYFKLLTLGLRVSIFTILKPQQQAIWKKDHFELIHTFFVTLWDVVLGAWRGQKVITHKVSCTPTQIHLHSQLHQHIQQEQQIHMTVGL